MGRISMRRSLRAVLAALALTTVAGGAAAASDPPGGVPLPAQACQRECLEGYMNKYLAAMAAHENVALKVSNFGAYSPDRSIPALRETVMGCIEAFGTRRSLFGTDYPVARRNMTYGAMVDAFAEIIAPFSAEEQGDLFYGNARRFYRFD